MAESSKYANYTPVTEVKPKPVASLNQDFRRRLELEKIIPLKCLNLAISRTFCMQSHIQTREKLNWQKYTEHTTHIHYIKYQGVKNHFGGSVQSHLV